MILTPLKIQMSIIKAYYSLALKTIKYYGGLIVGKNNTCLLKEARLLRKYVEILKNFKIVGSTITCTCCVEGEYTVLLNDLSELTEAKIQFSCDDTGGMYFNNINYPFTYFFDSNNKKLVIQFSTLIDPDTTLPYVLTLDDVNFTSDCSFTPNTISPIEEALVDEVTGIPVTVSNMYGDWSGNITIYSPPPGSTMLHTLTIPAAIMDDPEAIVNYWNTNGPTDWLLIYDGTQYTMLTPFDGTNYSGYIIEFNQYEGGVDSSILSTTFIPQNFVTISQTASVEIDIPDTFVGSVPAQALITPNVPDFVPNNTPAKVNITVAPNSFSTTHIASTMNISIDGGGAFGSSPPSNQYFYYNSTLMFSHIGPYANPAALVTDFNNNNGNGFTMTYIGPSPTPNHFLFEIESPLNTTLYNGNTITVAYNALPYPDDVGTFSGGVLPKPVDVTVSDTTNGTIYTITSPSFNSLQDFVNDFNTNAFGYVATIIPFAVSNNIQITAPISTGFAFNGTTLTYSTTGPTYSSTGTYFGGIDTTECTYTLELYDTGNVLVLPVIENTTPTNYPGLADIAADINSNPLNTYLFYTAAAPVPITGGLGLSVQFPYPFALPQSLTCNTYNGYTFILTINYTSPQYTPYTSAASMMDGGINAESNEFVITDGINGTIFSQTTNNFNYPNGSEIQNGFIPDFNANNTGALPLLYTAEYVGPGNPTPDVQATVNNPFLTQLIGEGMSNGSEIRAFISNPNTTFIGIYQAPTTGILPSYSQMIINLSNNILSQNIVPGLTSIFTGSGILLTAPPNTGDAYNGYEFKVYKYDHTLATVSFTFTANSVGGTRFQFSAGPNLIANVVMGALPTYTPNDLAQSTVTAINAIGGSTGCSATRVGGTVTITAPPYTGGYFNGTNLGTFILPTSSGTVSINGNTYLPNNSYTISSFSGGSTSIVDLNAPPDDVYFAGGKTSISTSRVRFRSPVQPTTSPQYGTGNWVYNFTTLSYDYNLGEYLEINGYSGGIDPTVGELIVDILDTLLNPYAQLYIDLTPQNYQSRQLLVNAFNATNPFPNNFQINLVSPTSAFCNILSPPTSFDYFNNYTFKYSYFYVSPQYTDYVDVTTTFSGGVDPVLTSYEGEFQQGDIGTFVTDNPCEATIAEQECLSNKQVSDIIKHINKLVR